MLPAYIEQGTDTPHKGKCASEERGGTWGRLN